MNSIGLFILLNNTADVSNVQKRVDEYKKINLMRERRRIRSASNPLDLPDSKFAMYFRLNKDAFVYLLNELQDKVPKRRSMLSVPLILKLAAVLRFFAEGSYQKGVGNDFNLGIAQPTMSLILKEMLEIMEVYFCPRWINAHYSDQEKREAKAFFYEKARIPGIIGCVDGSHIRIQAPKKQEQHHYYNRKGFFSLNAMFVCDHKMRIRYVDARHAGASHDSFVWNSSELRGILQRNFESGDRNTWLLGDAGYPLEPFLITPFRSAQERSSQSDFNMRHSKSRNIIERTIGVLKNHFRCLLGARLLHYTPQKSTQIVNICSALHNICIYYKTHPPIDQNHDVVEHISPDSDFNHDNLVENNQIAINIRNQLLQE